MSRPQRRTAVVTAMVVTAVLALPGLAAASWAATGAGSAAVSARTLPRPGDVTATCTGLTSIKVDWTSPTGAPLVVDFQVQQSTDGGSTWTTAATVPATAATAYSHTATSLGVATYVFRVVARNASWRQTSAVSASRTIMLGLCS